MQMLVHLMSQWSLRLCLYLLPFFLLFCSGGFHHAVFSSHIHFSVSITLLLIPSRVFFVSVTALFISVCLLFSSLHLCYMFLTHFWSLPLFFPRDPGSVFTIITLNSFSGRLSVSLSCSTDIISHSFIWDIFFAVSFCLIFFDCDFHSAGCRTVVFLAFAVYSLVDEAV